MIVAASSRQTTLAVTVDDTAVVTNWTEKILTAIVFPAVLGVIVLVLVILAIYSYVRWRRQRTTAVTETVVYVQTPENGKCLSLSNVCSYLAKFCMWYKSYKSKSWNIISLIHRIGILYTKSVFYFVFSSCLCYYSVSVALAWSSEIRHISD